MMRVPVLCTRLILSAQVKCATVTAFDDTATCLSRFTPLRFRVEIRTGFTKYLITQASSQEERPRKPDLR